MRYACCFLLCALMLGACGQSPTEAYESTIASAQAGDREAFLDGFTDRSRDLVDAMLRLSDTYGVETTNPYELLVYDSVDSERIDGDDRAVLTVRRGKLTRELLLTREDGDWRIDTQDLADFWKEAGRP